MALGPLKMKSRATWLLALSVATLSAVVSTQAGRFSIRTEPPCGPAVGGLTLCVEVNISQKGDAREPQMTVTIRNIGATPLRVQDNWISRAIAVRIERLDGQVLTKVSGGDDFITLDERLLPPSKREASIRLDPKEAISESFFLEERLEGTRGGSAVPLTPGVYLLKSKWRPAPPENMARVGGVKHWVGTLESGAVQFHVY